jgi:hypothetical protein
MRKPVKKAAPKKLVATRIGKGPHSTKASKSPLSGANRRVKPSIDEHVLKFEQSGKPWAKDSGGVTVTVEGTDIVRVATPEEAQALQTLFRAHMASLGAKGGTVSGAKRMDMPANKRREVALKAAQARWAKRR